MDYAVRGAIFESADPLFERHEGVQHFRRVAEAIRPEGSIDPNAVGEMYGVISLEVADELTAEVRAFIDRRTAELLGPRLDSLATSLQGRVAAA